MLRQISAVQALKGEISVPGDKSISHRALIIGALAQGKTEIHGFLPGADCLSTLNCLRQMGIEIELINNTTLIVNGSGLYGLKEPNDCLDAGNSGTTARLLLGILAGQNFFTVLTGDGSLRSRPMSRVIQPLQTMGAQIFGRNNNKLLPAVVLGQKKLKGITYNSSIASAQLKSALLLAGLYAEEPTTIFEPSRSRDHSERMLKSFGVSIDIHNNVVTINPSSKLEAGKILIPGDISSAAFFIVAGLIVPNSEIMIKNVGINPTRSGIITILKEMGGNISILNERKMGEEPVADLLVKSSELRGTEIKGDIIPTLIDEIPVLAVAGLFAQGETIISDAAELRVKESDRIAVMAKELNKIGGHVTELPDGLNIKGDQELHGARCSSHHDHRIAMSLAIAGLRTGNLEIEDYECIDISYPNFFSDLNMLMNN
ncbi:3-phosphoshikimate 1-carboxyvinyltransferase [Bacillota bacterium LX-D]|nr:3-phosphoshikimate 1-carboxyvinyltransferase [Bacillota bacterium LX-D]